MVKKLNQTVTVGDFGVDDYNDDDNDNDDDIYLFLLYLFIYLVTHGTTRGDTGRHSDKHLLELNAFTKEIKIKQGLDDI